LKFYILSSGDSQYLSTHRIAWWGFLQFPFQCIFDACRLLFAFYALWLYFPMGFFPAFYSRYLPSANRLHYIRNQLSVEQEIKNKGINKKLILFTCGCPFLVVDFPCCEQRKMVGLMGVRVLVIVLFCYKPCGICGMIKFLQNSLFPFPFNNGWSTTIDRDPIFTSEYCVPLQADVL